MNRLAGIVTAAVGFVVCILSIVGVIPGLTGTGIALLLLGGLVIGLSFIDQPTDPGVERMSTGSTLVNIFFSPSEVFRNLKSHPRWLVALLTMSILGSMYSMLFHYRLTPERVANYTIDKTLEMPLMNDQAREQIEKGRAEAIAQAKSPVRQAGTVVGSFAGAVFGYAFLALIFFLIVMAMGGKLGWWQAFAATVYAAFPFSVIRSLLNTIILFIRDPAEIHPILGQSTLIQDNLNFLVTAKDHPVIFVFLGSLSILGFYWMWLNATGLKNVGDKVTGTMAWGASIAIYVLMMILGMTVALLFPSFIS